MTFAIVLLLVVLLCSTYLLHQWITDGLRERAP
jgi:hypothetical protein